MKPFILGLKGGAKKSPEGNDKQASSEQSSMVVREPPHPIITFKTMLHPAKKSKSKFSQGCLSSEEFKQAKERLSTLFKKKWVLIDGYNGLLVFSGKKVSFSNSYAN